MSRHSHLYYESCQKILAARAADTDSEEKLPFECAAAALEHSMPHCVRTVFHNAAAYDLRMQRAVSSPTFIRCEPVTNLCDFVMQLWPNGLADELMLATDVHRCFADASFDCSDNNITGNSLPVMFGGNGEVVVAALSLARRRLSSTSTVGSPINGLLHLSENIAEELRSFGNSAAQKKEQARDDLRTGLTPDGRPEVCPLCESLMYLPLAGSDGYVGRCWWCWYCCCF
jgi:hypothetical protein